MLTCAPELEASFAYLSSSRNCDGMSFSEISIILVKGDKNNLSHNFNNIKFLNKNEKKAHIMPNKYLLRKVQKLLLHQLSIHFPLDLLCTAYDGIVYKLQTNNHRRIKQL